MKTKSVLGIEMTESEYVQIARAYGHVFVKRAEARAQDIGERLLAGLGRTSDPFNEIEADYRLTFDRISIEAVIHASLFILRNP
jgi:hypothetical protein